MGSTSAAGTAAAFGRATRTVWYPSNPGTSHVTEGQHAVYNYHQRILRVQPKRQLQRHYGRLLFEHLVPRRFEQLAGRLAGEEAEVRAVENAARAVVEPARAEGPAAP